MDSPPDFHVGLLADVETARAQYPQTQALYSEVCAVLFFRYGITPTANKLSQLVRKGSMSAPAEALNRFWAQLREKSRVSIDQPDLPEVLRISAGEMASTIWHTARGEAAEQFAALRAEVQSKVSEAEVNAADAVRTIKSAQEELAETQTALLELRGLLEQARHEVTFLTAEKSGLEAQVQSAKNDLTDNKNRLDQVRADFAAELEKIRFAAGQSDERGAAAERRALREIDRERAHALQLRKALDAAMSNSEAKETRAQNDILALTRQLTTEVEGWPGLRFFSQKIS